MHLEAVFNALVLASAVVEGLAEVGEEEEEEGLRTMTGELMAKPESISATPPRIGRIQLITAFISQNHGILGTMIERLELTLSKSILIRRMKTTEGEQHMATQGMMEEEA